MSGKKGSAWIWTPDALDRLADLICDGLTDPEIAHLLGKSRNAIKLARQRHLGIFAKNRCDLAETRSGRDVARLLGIACAKTVTHWIAAGWLSARRGVKVGPHWTWHIRDEDLLAFLQNSAHWQRWDPARITDDGWREWATSIRIGDRYLTTGQVAARFFMGSRAVYQWIRKNELPAVRRGNWLIRESDLAGFVPPCERPRVYRPRQRRAA